MEAIKITGEDFLRGIQFTKGEAAAHIGKKSAASIADFGTKGYDARGSEFRPDIKVPGGTSRKISRIMHRVQAPEFAPSHARSDYNIIVELVVVSEAATEPKAVLI